jgi:hypothetical protein
MAKKTGRCVTTAKMTPELRAAIRKTVKYLKSPAGQRKAAEIFKDTERQLAVYRELQRPYKYK